MAKTIKVPRPTWRLGDREQQTISGLTVSRRPLYYDGGNGPVRIGVIDPDYAEQLMEKLNA